MDEGMDSMRRQRDALSRDYGNAAVVIGRLETKLATANDKLRVAREVIEKAPHHKDCRLSIALRTDQFCNEMILAERGEKEFTCDCWKSRALSALDAQPPSDPQSKGTGDEKV